MLNSGSENYFRDEPTINEARNSCSLSAGSDMTAGGIGAAF
jgi:hypothetical protein